MLRQLHIRNYALIEELDIPFHPGFSVITGETGAGKSIILGAIGLLLGQRATHLPSLPEGKKCTVEAHFDISNYEMNAFFTDNDIDYDPEDTILRREISSTGKSRMFINDTPVTLSLIRELGEQLIDIHSQHQNLLLNKEDFQLNVIDIMAADGVQLNDYKSTFTAYSQANRQLNELIEEIERNKENEEYLRFQFNELEEAKLVDGEQEELEQMSETMTHSEEIKSTLYDITNSLNGEQNGIVNLLKSSAQQLRHIEKVFPAAEELATRLESTHIEMKDIAQEMEAKLEDIDFNPQQLEALNERLDRIYSLQQRFHVNSVSELLEIHHT
ncbi:MAG: AAA family ATPase, partial [Prevotella sp.]|nr:AAA family ATPase [Prevotella sp.]